MVPTGTVTFLFTDLQGSTRAWEDHPEEMRRSVARHDELQRTAIAAHGGYVFATGGDAFAATFTTAPAAAACAIEVQRSLRSEAWPAPIALRSRMGIHTGTAHERDDNYFGPTVNRAARIMSAAHGGQVLVSGAASALMARDEFDLVELGEFRLKDLLEPERLFQLVIDGDAGAYPSPNALDRYDTNLPVVRTSLIGRTDEVTEIRKLLGEHAVVTLTGIGGVGKTRMALEVAAQELGAHDGVYFVDLAVVSDTSEVVAAVAGALDLPTGGGALDTVIRMLQRFSTLVVLDNCEHLLDDVCELVEEINAHCPRCRILATSREPLGIAGERVWRAPSLDVDAGVELFRERALSVRDDITLDDASVRELCRHLDGIALAVELAAARVSHLTVEEILAHLDERFDLLTGGRRRARQRHQTLEATLDWSYDLLTPDEQAVLRACSVCAGTFTVDALAAITDRSLSSVRNLVGALVDKSLVAIGSTSSGRSRYRLLETVRIYAQAKLLAADEATDARTRHASHFVSMARSALEVDWTGWWREVDSSDLENFLAAAEWTESTGDLAGTAAVVSHLMATEMWADSSWRFLDRADIAGALEGAQLVRYLLASMVNANRLGEFPRQQAIGLRATALGTDDPATGNMIHGLLANAQSITDPDEALRTIEAAIARYGRDAPASPMLLGRIVDVAIMRGRLDEALELMSSPGFYGGIREPEFVLVALGRFEEAVRWLTEQTVQSVTYAGDYREALILAIAEAARGHHEVATEHLATAMRAIDRRPFRLLDRDVLLGAAALAYHRGDVERAAVLLSVERSQLHAVRSPGSWALYLRYRDLVRAALDRSAVEAAKIAGDRLTISAAIAEELMR